MEYNQQKKARPAARKAVRQIDIERFTAYPEAQHPDRNYGVDLLRIAAMLMITVMHALVRGGVIFGGAQIGVNFYLSWIVQALCEVATDCFFLISGYYLVNQQVKLSRTVRLWATVLFYSWTIYLIFIPLGLVDQSHTPLLGSILPVTTNNYWFMTSYIALSFLSPYINLALHAMDRRQMRDLILILIVLFSVWPVLAPMAMTFEHHGGIGIAWSLVVYLCAAYLRLHVTKLPKKWVCLAVYAGCSAVALILRFIFSHLGNTTSPGMLDYANTILTYNSPLTFAAAVALFLFFLQIRVKQPAAKRLIHVVAPTVLASYLITEQHNMIDYLWTKWIPMRSLADRWWFLGYLFLVAAGILLVCCAIDHVRQALFAGAERLLGALRSRETKR